MKQSMTLIFEDYDDPSNSDSDTTGDTLAYTVLLQTSDSSVDETDESDVQWLKKWTYVV